MAGSYGSRVGVRVARMAGSYGSRVGVRVAGDQLLEARFDGALQVVAGLRHRAARHDGRRERPRQRLRRLVTRQAARAQVEEGGLVELAHGRAVGALHVLGVDLELGLGVDLGLRRQEQVVIRLLRVRAVRAGVHQRLAVEHTARAPVQDAAVFLGAPGRAHAVIHAGVIVDVLASVGEVKAVQRDGGAGPADVRRDVVANQPAAEVDGGMLETRVAREGHVQAPDLVVLAGAFLDPQPAQAGTRREGDVDEHVRELRVRADGSVHFDDRGPGVRAGIDHDVRQADRIRVRRIVEHEDAEGPFEHRAGREAHGERVAPQRRVEERECVGVRQCRRHFGRRARRDARLCQRLERGGLDPAIRDDDPMGIDRAGCRGGKLPGGRRRPGRLRYARGRRLQPAVAHLDRGSEIGVLPLLLAGRGEARFAEAGKRRLAGGRERVVGDASDDLLQQVDVDRALHHAVAASRTQS